MTSAGRSRILAGDYLILQLPSGVLRPIEIQLNTTISIGKFGSFHSNSLIGRPYHLTYEIVEKREDEKHSKLRVVPAAELNSESLSTQKTAQDENIESAINGEAFDIVGENGQFLIRNNRVTVDDPSRQALSLEEIEDLKKAGTGSGKEVIAKIMAAHSALGEKTSFSLAKYTLRKSRKFLKRFTAVPMDVTSLTEYMLERDAPRIMDLRPETLGLITSWANVRNAGQTQEQDLIHAGGDGRFLVVDDTGGLIVAALAERMGILYPAYGKQSSHDDTHNGHISPIERTMSIQDSPIKRHNLKEFHQSAASNTITVVHSHTQPNFSMLKYFGFLLEDSPEHHPLFTNLKTLSWLQLKDPEADAVYMEKPPDIAEAEFESWKSGKRGAHYRKIRRWERTRRVVDETRNGGFDGLVVASFMKPDGILEHLVPLVKGGGQVVVYSPNTEPLTELVDLYSRERRGAYIKLLQNSAEDGDVTLLDEKDFPVNPTLLLHPMLQTARAVEWQVLPGRTHPLMTSRGGPEGYVFSATRVIPAGGRVNARGTFQKKRRLETEEKPGKKSRTNE